MECKLRIVVEKLDPQTNKIVEKTTIDTFDIHKPEKIIAVGLRHFQQINLLRSIQQKYCNVISSAN